MRGTKALNKNLAPRIHSGTDRSGAIRVASKVIGVLAIYRRHLIRYKLAKQMFVSVIQVKSWKEIERLLADDLD